MIKTIDTNEITEEMFQAFRDNYVDATRCIFAVLGAAPAVEPVQAVPPGYRLQAIAEFDAMNELIRLNDDLTIAYMSGKHDQKAIDHDKKQRTLDFVRWIASLKTGGLIQARANDILKLLEAGNGE